MPSDRKALPLPRKRDERDKYSYRRPLSLREMLPAVGIAVAAGFVAFYVTRLLLQRTPLHVERGPRARGRERSARS